MEIKKERREWRFSLILSLIGWGEWIQHLFNLSVIRKKHWNDIELCFEVFETKNQSINYYWFTVHIEILPVVLVNHSISSLRMDNYNRIQIMIQKEIDRKEKKRMKYTKMIVWENEIDCCSSVHELVLNSNQFQFILFWLS